MSRRKASTKATAYAKALTQQVGETRARYIGRQVLGCDILEQKAPDANRLWHRVSKLDLMSADEATKLINALLDEAGRKGRRRNNRRSTR
jgi:hypothetical protein